ncbi:DNA-binding protein [Pseudomonas mandelii PD30]|uniref:DNA-binding protein n=1 Tax=Pseudomonas mandelii PD30 TaxID=1419583 RepID=A0A059L0Y9_9PSED|nr:alpha-xenorhabdolysin family binary toxin subunit A [Pseudomonas mandelii]KDD67992.1 DNA-binding protein [Pseudomonas mandelii PD30]
MSDNKLWAASLQGASYEKVTEFATEVPKLLTDASTADSDGVTRDTGLLLTKKQIIDLRKYEAAGLALPYTLQDVIDYLRFGAGQDGGAGLKAADFLKTFTDTRDHAKRWSPLRERIMLTGTELKLFGASMQTYGDDMQEVYDDLKAAPLLDKHNIKTLAELKTLKINMGGKFPGIELEPDTLPDIQHYLSKIFARVASNLANVSAIKTDLDKFGYDLREKVLPGIKLRVGLIQTNSYPADIKAQDQVITRRAAEIQEKNTQYKALVEKALGSAAGLNIFGLGMAIYYGVEAENVRAERKKLNEQQDKDIEILKNMNQTLGSLKRVEHDLQNLTVVAIDADLATQNLMHVWNVMHRYVTESATAISGINDALSLRRFMSPFREVVSPWVQIHQDADALIQVFKDADQEYSQSQVMAAPRMMRTMFIEQQQYSVLDLQALKNSQSAMLDDGITAEALFIRLNYLPGVFDRFKRLVGDVNASARDLRECSLNSKMDLESRIRKLAALEAELAGAVAGSEEYLEIEVDIATELKKLPVLTGKQAGKISTRLANISDGYDQGVTRGFAAGLEKDLAGAREVKAELGEYLVNAQGELKAVADAISAIEKTAIEKIGNDVALTIDKIQALGMAPPQAQIVMFAIEQLKKSMADINDGISFLNMIHESRKLQEKVNDLFKRIAQEDKNISQTLGRIEFIRVVHSLDDQRQVYVSEYKNAVVVFADFLSAVEKNKTSDLGQRVSLAIKEVKKLVTFLAPVSLP